MKKIISLVLALVLLMGTVACSSEKPATAPVGGTETNQTENNTENEATGESETAGGEATGESDPSAELSEEDLELLASVGMSAESVYGMDPEQRKAILDELRAVMDDKAQQAVEKEEHKSYTVDDVMAGGSYRVVMGDYMNSITLYYENGKLVKLVEDFQKSDEEEAMAVEYTGDALAEYGFNFIDWDNASLQEILDGMKDYGGYSNYKIAAN